MKILKGFSCRSRRCECLVIVTIDGLAASDQHNVFNVCINVRINGGFQCINLDNYVINDNFKVKSMDNWLQDAHTYNCCD